VKVQSLYGKVDHACVRVGIVLACSWLFAAFSYYLSRKTGSDWFARSGSVMALIGAAATFRLTAGFQKQLATGLKEGLASVRQEIEVVLNPPPLYRLTSYFGYVTGIVGTAIWAMGTCCLDEFFPRPTTSNLLRRGSITRNSSASVGHGRNVGDVPVARGQLDRPERLLFNFIAIRPSL